jgi:type IV pilus assembly protein PilM
MKTNFFKKLFYPPNYICMPVAGVDICNRSIKYIEFSNKNGNFALKNFGEIPLSENIIKNGEILNKRELVKALSELKKKISADFISVSIPEEKSYMFYTSIPNIKGSDIRQAIEFRLEENIPIKVDEAAFEYHLIKNKKDEMGNIFVSVSVIPKNVVAQYSEVLDLAGLSTTSFEIESRMAAKSIVQKDGHKTFIIVNIKDDSTILSLVADGTTRFTSTINLGDNVIRESLLKIDKTLYDEQGRFSDKVLSYNGTSNSDSFDSLLNVFSVMKDEVEKFYDYVASKSNDKKSFLSGKIDQIIMCGKSSILPGFTSHISQNLSTEVVLANVWVNILNTNDYIPNLKFQDSLGFAVPIGLVVNSLKNVNHA